MFFTTLLKFLGVVPTIIGAVAPGSKAANTATSIGATVAMFLNPLSAKFVKITDLHSAYTDLGFIHDELVALGAAVPASVLDIVTRMYDLLGAFLDFKPLNNADNALYDLALAFKAAQAEGVAIPAIAQTIASYVEQYPQYEGRIETGSAIKVPISLPVEIKGKHYELDGYLCVHGSTDIPPSYAPAA